jgi:hypothetical protein
VANELIVRTYQDVPIGRRTDGYWDATAMCQATGKRWQNYWRNQETQEFLAELSSITRIRVMDLVKSRVGGSPETTGTWVHPRVALDLARWCSPKFAVQMNAWVEELLTKGKVELQPKPHTLSDRVRLLPFVWPLIPPGYWSVFTETAGLLVFAEAVFTAAQFELHKFDLLDGSIGRCWALYRKKQQSLGAAWLREPKQFPYTFPDVRSTQMVKAYHNDEHEHFRHWLITQYLREDFFDYCVNKEGFGLQRLLAARPIFAMNRLPIPLRLMQKAQALGYLAPSLN